MTPKRKSDTQSNAAWILVILVLALYFTRDANTVLTGILLTLTGLATLMTAIAITLRITPETNPLFWGFTLAVWIALLIPPSIILA